MIDHTLLKEPIEPAQIDKLCQEARDNNFATVCVRLEFVAQAAANLKDKPMDEDDFPLSKGAAFFADEDAFAAYQKELGPLGPEVRLVHERRRLPNADNGR